MHVLDHLVKNKIVNNENLQLGTRNQMLHEILIRTNLRQEIEDYAFLIEMMEYDMKQHRNRLNRIANKWFVLDHDLQTFKIGYFT